MSATRRGLIRSMLGAVPALGLTSFAVAKGDAVGFTADEIRSDKANVFDAQVNAAARLRYILDLPADFELRRIDLRQIHPRPEVLFDLSTVDKIIKEEKFDEFISLLYKVRDFSLVLTESLKDYWPTDTQVRDFFREKRSQFNSNENI